MVNKKEYTSMTNTPSSKMFEISDDFGVYGPPIPPSNYFDDLYAPKNNTIIANELSDLYIDGVSVKESLNSMNQIKEMLLILQRDITMEERYPELKEAYDNYNEILKQLRVMEKLADGPNTE